MLVTPTIPFPMGEYSMLVLVEVETEVGVVIVVGLVPPPNTLNRFTCPSSPTKCNAACTFIATTALNGLNVKAGI